LSCIVNNESMTVSQDDLRIDHMFCVAG
jgi:hypothetical protein